MGGLLGKEQQERPSIGVRREREDDHDRFGEEKGGHGPGEEPLPPPLVRQTCESVPKDGTEMLDIGRLSASAVERLLPDREGPGADVIFSVLAAAHLARQRQRLDPRVPCGGFAVWAMENCARECRWASLGGMARLLDEYGTSAAYEDRRGAADPVLGDLVEADHYPSVRGVRLSRNPETVQASLRGGDAVVCTWSHAGHSRATLSDGTAVRKVDLAGAVGVVGEPDIASGCLVGYDPHTDLFYGHAPASVGANALVALSSDFVERRCLDLLCLRLEERARTEDGSSGGDDSGDDSSALGEESEEEPGAESPGADIDCGSTVDSWSRVADSPPRPEVSSMDDID